jgi:hypothetical protein
MDTVEKRAAVLRQQWPEGTPFLAGRRARSARQYDFDTTTIGGRIFDFFQNSITRSVTWAADIVRQITLKVEL